MAELIDETFHKSKRGDQVKIFDFMIQINDYFNKNNLKEYNIRISKNFLKVQMIMAMSQGIGIMLCKKQKEKGLIDEEGFKKCSENVVNSTFDIN